MNKTKKKIGNNNQNNQNAKDVDVVTLVFDNRWS